MLRNSYGPEYGEAGGAVISIVTRSGTNDWHGTVNYFGRNDAVSAFEYFAKHSQGLNGKPVKDELRRNETIWEDFVCAAPTMLTVQRRGPKEREGSNPTGFS